MNEVLAPPRRCVWLGLHPLGTPSESVEKQEIRRTKRRSVITPPPPDDSPTFRSSSFLVQLLDRSRWAPQRMTSQDARLGGGGTPSMPAELRCTSAQSGTGDVKLKLNTTKSLLVLSSSTRRRFYAQRLFGQAVVTGVFVPPALYVLSLHRSYGVGFIQHCHCWSIFISFAYSRNGSMQQYSVNLLDIQNRSMLSYPVTF